MTTFRNRGRILKWVFVWVCGAFPFYMASGQVVIEPLKHDGWLRWTNHVISPLPPPVYRVETGTGSPVVWRSVLSVTNALSSQLLTNAQSGMQTSAVYRIAWLNGQLWNIQIEDSGGIAITGKLYLASSFNRGTWYLTYATSGIPFHFTGKGWVTYEMAEEPETIRLRFSSGVLDDTEFWLEGPWPATNPWQGTWHERGIATERVGGFIATRPL
jgi:hypothetical protein